MRRPPAEAPRGGSALAGALHLLEALSCRGSWLMALSSLRARSSLRAASDWCWSRLFKTSRT